MGDPGSSPWVGKIPWRRTWQPTPVRSYTSTDLPILPSLVTWEKQPPAWWCLTQVSIMCSLTGVTTVSKKEIWPSTLATWCEELTHWKRPWCCARPKAGGEGDNRGWDGWMASLTLWTWVCASSGSWWWTRRPGVLQSMGSQRVRTEERNSVSTSESLTLKNKGPRVTTHPLTRKGQWNKRENRNLEGGAMKREEPLPSNTWVTSSVSYQKIPWSMKTEGQERPTFEEQKELMKIKTVKAKD